VDTTNWAEISTKKQVEIDDDLFQPPNAVMQTAIMPRNVSKNIEFTMDLESFPSDRSLGYIHAMYFSELQELPPNALRQYYINRNGELLTFSDETDTYTPSYLGDGYVFSAQPFQASQYNVSINATAKSTLPPIINAIELFSIISTTTVGTDSHDGAIMHMHTHIRELARWSLSFMHACY
jgi:hypothetical protein